MSSKKPNSLLVIAGYLLCALALLTGFSLECSAFLPFFTEPGTKKIVFASLMLKHTAASTLMAWALYRLLPLKYQADFIKGFGYYFLLSFFIPLIGSLGLLLVFLLGICREKKLATDDHIWRVTGQALMPNQAPDLNERPKFGASGMLSRLRRSNNSSQHLGIVLATRFMGDDNAIPLLNTALRNPEDDVRLLAFSLLEKKSTDINSHIENLQKNLQNEDKKAKTHIAIARNYLRLVILKLIQDEMKDQALQKAEENLKKALKENPEERNGHFILGQVLLERDDVDQAELSFTKALQLGFSPTAVYPFLAHIAFLRRQFKSIPEYLNNIPPERRRYPPLAGIASYWL